MQIIYNIWIGFLRSKCHILYIQAILQQLLQLFMCIINSLSSKWVDFLMKGIYNRKKDFTKITL